MNMQSAKVLKQPVFLCVVFVSGWSSLTYQVSWERLFVINFGVDFYSVSAITAAFLSGLGLGAYFIGKLCDRLKNSMRLYAFLEIAIGVFGFCSVSLIQSLYPLAIELQTQIDSIPLYFMINFVIVFLVILIPTMLMGGTLPVMIKYLYHSNSEIGSLIGRLYSVNTFGSVVGALLAAFVTMSVLNVDGSIYFAATMNLCIGLLCLFWSNNNKDSTLENSKTVSSKQSKYPDYFNKLLWLYLLASVVAIAFEIIWFRIISLHWQNSTGGFGLVLGFYLVGIAIGSFIYAKFISKLEKGLFIFASLQMLAVIASFTGLALYSLFLDPLWVSAESILLNIYHLMHPEVQLGNKLVDGGLAHLISDSFSIVLVYGSLITLPMIIQGMTFPLVVRLAATGGDDIGSDTGKVYLVSIVGSFIGAFLSGYVLLPVLGINNSLLFLFIISFSIGLFGFLLSNNNAENAKKRYKLAPSVIALCCIVLMLILPGNYLQLLSPGKGDITTSREGITGVTFIKEFPQHNSTAVVINGQNHGALKPYKYSRDDAKIAVAVNLHPKPKKVLLIGLGNARTLAAVLRYTEIGRVDVVEISRELLPVLQSRKEIDWLQNTLNDSRVNFVMDDGRMYLARTQEKYDIIAMAPIFSHNAYGGYLFSKEFFQAVKKRLFANGIFIELNDCITPDMRFILLNTFKSVFPHFYLDSGNYLYGLNSPLVPNKERIAESWEANKISLSKLKFDQGGHPLAQQGEMMSHLRSNQNAFLDIDHYPLNTDLHPRTEFWLFQFNKKSSTLPLPLRRRNVAYDFTKEINNLNPIQLKGLDLSVNRLRVDNFSSDSNYRTDLTEHAMKIHMQSHGNLKIHNGYGKLGQPPLTDEVKISGFNKEKPYFFRIKGKGSGVLEMQVQHWNVEKKKWTKLALKHAMIEHKGNAILRFYPKSEEGYYRFVVGAYTAGDWEIKDLSICEELTETI